jgi:hypothetical protein
MLKIWLTGASPIWGMDRWMDDYTFPFFLSLAMAIVCIAAAVAHGVGL